MSNNLIPYGLESKENGTSEGIADSSKSKQNVAVIIAISSILPLLIVIFLLVIIVMSVNNAFGRIFLLT